MNPTDLPASVQFYDNLETISDMRVRRFPLRRIWLTLTESGKYSGDYTHFCRLAKKEFGEELKSKKHSPPAKVPLLRVSENTKAPTTPTPSNHTLEEDDGPLMFMDDITTKKKS